MLALDIETDGLSFIDNNIVAIGIMKDGEDVEVYTYFDDWKDGKDEVRNLLLNLFATEEVVVHNSVFDIPFLCRYFDLPIPSEIWDTLVAERLLTAGLELSVSLSEVSKRRLGTELDKTYQTSFTLEEPLGHNQVQYLRDDVRNLLEIRAQQEGEIEFDNVEMVWEIEQGVTPVFINMVTRGIPVNRDKLQEFIDKVDGDKEALAVKLWEYLTPYIMEDRIRKFDEQKAKLDHYLHQVNVKTATLEDEAEAQELDEKEAKRYVREGLKAWRTYNKRPPKPKMDDSFINLDSPQQVQEALNRIGVRVDNTSRASIKSILPNLSGEKQAVVSDLLSYKKLSKLSNAFGDKLMSYLDEVGNLHGIFNQYGADTGRPTCKEPNLLQIPSSDEFRRLFYGGDEYSLVFADYAQMELRLVAELSRDMVMMQAFTDDLDLHRYTASLMYNTPFEDVTDQQRKIAKNINFMVLYGGGHNKLRSMLAPEGVFMSEKEAEEAMNTWRKTYWRAAHAIKEWGSQAVRYGETRTAMGRPRRFDRKTIKNKYDEYRIQRQGANHVIQGSNADITKLAMILVHENLPEGAYVALQIYDEIVVIVRKGDEYEGMKVLYHSMVAAAEEVLKQTPVGVDCYYSPTWSEKDAEVTYDGTNYIA